MWTYHFFVINIIFLIEFFDGIEFGPFDQYISFLLMLGIFCISSMEGYIFGTLFESIANHVQGP